MADEFQTLLNDINSITLDRDKPMEEMLPTIMLIHEQSVKAKALYDRAKVVLDTINEKMRFLNPPTVMRIWVDKLSHYDVEVTIVQNLDEIKETSNLLYYVKDIKEFAARMPGTNKIATGTLCNINYNIETPVKTRECQNKSHYPYFGAKCNYYHPHSGDVFNIYIQHDDFISQSVLAKIIRGEAHQDDVKLSHLFIHIILASMIKK